MWFYINITVLPELDKTHLAAITDALIYLPLVCIYMLKVTFLGTGGSLPTTNRNPSAIAIQREGELILFDCGEGAQQQMMRARTGMMKLTSIFVTHFHADHILGIPGLIQTMSFQGRKEPLAVYGPKRMRDFGNTLMGLGYYSLTFDVNFVEMEPGREIDFGEYVVRALRTDHGIASIGFALMEKERSGRFNKATALELGVPEGRLFGRLQRGEAVTVDGKTITPEQVLGPPRPGRKIVYSGDTRPCDDIINISQGADMLIHDSSLTDDMAQWAQESKHTTAGEAAKLALDAGVRKLVLTHISSRYSESKKPIEDDARKIYPDAIVAEDLMSIEIPLRDE